MKSEPTVASSMSENIFITDRLNRWSENPLGSCGSVFDLLNSRLRLIAQRLIVKRRRDFIFQTTEVVNEAYLRLAGAPPTHWNNREHFFGYCAQVMRHVLVDVAKARMRQKRGSGEIHVVLDGDLELPDAFPVEEILDVHQALIKLSALDPERAKVVELRYFGGMEPHEIGRVLHISESTVHRRWRVARAWLYRTLSR